MNGADSLFSGEKWKIQTKLDIPFGVLVPEDTKYFAPSQSSYMFNFRVKNIDHVLTELKKEGVEIVGKVEEHPNGKFAWILDLEGRKIELWEPVESDKDPYL